MTNPIDTWLAHNLDPAADPLPGMREAGLLEPAPDYATIARTKSALVQRTGLLGIGSVWGGRQLVFRHFLRFGTDAQRAQWSGQALAVAISEPKVGAHPKLLTTRAERDDTHYSITGEKAWVTNGPTADAIIVIAITAEDQGRKRYSAFLVPRDTPGLGISDMPGFHALRPSRHCLLTLDACRVPASAMLGPEGTAYERMALPFRDLEDAVGTFGTLGALRHAISLFTPQDAPPQNIDTAQDAAALGAIVALTAVFEAGASAIVAALDAQRFRTGDATLVGLRILAADITDRLRVQAHSLSNPTALLALLDDLDATASVARGPRLARQTMLGEATLRTAP